MSLPALSGTLFHFVGLGPFLSKAFKILCSWAHDPRLPADGAQLLCCDLIRWEAREGQEDEEEDQEPSQRLQLERRNYRTYNTTVDRLFQMFPPSPDLIESSPDRCRACAVVGNSGNLIGSHYGPLIDFHDVVIRMNTGRIKGYEADVGIKTTHRIMYPESAIDLDNSTHLVLFPFKIQDLEWLIKAFGTGFSGRLFIPNYAVLEAPLSAIAHGRGLQAHSTIELQFSTVS
eukprot:superscaffoldBa00000005_g100